MIRLKTGTHICVKIAVRTAAPEINQLDFYNLDMKGTINSKL